MKCLLFLTLLPLLAQDTGALIEGTVTNSLTGEAIKKCRLSLRRMDGKAGAAVSASTDAEGRFHFEGLDAGQYKLSAEKNGFVNQEFGARGINRPGSTLTLDRGMQLKGLSFKLMPQGAVSGKVVDDDGDPIVGASVQLLRSMFADGRQQLAPTGFAQTNDLGEYRIFAVNPGKYYLSAAISHHGGEKGDESFPPTYYPAAIDPAAAGRLDVAAGAQLRGMDLALRKTRTLRIRGKFTGPGSETGSRSGSLQLYPRSLAGMASLMRNFMVVRGVSGTFDMPNVLPGSYFLAIDQNEEKDKHYYARVPIEVGNSDIDNLQVTLVEGMELNGRIRIEGASDVNLASAMVFLKARDMQFGSTPNSRVKADGTFTLSSVPPGWHRVVFGGPTPGLYIKSIRFGDDDALINGLNASGPNTIEIVLSSKGGQIDGQTSPGARVGLVPRSGLAEFFKATTADPEGRYSFRAVAPGDYLVLAMEEAEADLLRDPEFIKKYESSGESVSIKEGGRETRQLKAIAISDAP